MLSLCLVSTITKQGNVTIDRGENIKISSIKQTQKYCKASVIIHVNVLLLILGGEGSSKEKGEVSIYKCFSDLNVFPLGFIKFHTNMHCFVDDEKQYKMMKKKNISFLI